MPTTAGPHHDRRLKKELHQLLCAALSSVASLGVEVSPDRKDSRDSRLRTVFPTPGSCPYVDFLATPEHDRFSGGHHQVGVEGSAHRLAFAWYFVAHLYALIGG